MDLKPSCATAALQSALAACLAIGASCAHADVRTDTQPDLLFVLWDSAARVSYTLDLGIDANSFWTLAQQDAGYAWQYTIPAGDARFTAFRAASTTATNQRWAVIGVQGNPDALAPGNNKVYTTLHQGPGGDVVNPNWQDMTGMASLDFLNTTKRAPTRWLRDLNSVGGSENAAMNTHAASTNGSGFHSAGSARYFANNTTFSAKLNPGADGGFYGGYFDVTNAVNQSSWFYAISNAPSDSDKVVVDEFDNLSSNGYWGLALTSGNTYLLSFTQVAARSGTSSATTDLGIQRVSGTDYAADAGAARLLSFSDAVTAVPEPGTWALLGLGLAGLIARTRQRR